MSYILDALRRSQAERERGQVPGLNAQPLQSVPAPAPVRRGAGLWLGAALAVALLVAAGVVARMRLAPPPAAPPPAVPLATAVPPPPAAAPATVLQVPPAAASPPPLPLVVSAPVPAEPPRTAPSSAPSSVPASAPAPVPAAPRQLAFNQLTPEQRRELPVLAIGGAIWSENPASRFVIVNGQVLREGDTVAPGVVLERIAPKAALLRWRDLRIELPF